MADANARPDAALRPLHAARDARASLRLGGDPETWRAAFLRLADAVEAVLRRLLRDDPGAPLELRLRALAPDELSAEEVMAALRQRDRLSLELAAAFHELLAARRRVNAGGSVAQRDAELALETAERLERETMAAAWPAAAVPSAEETLAEPPPAAAADAPARGARRPVSLPPREWLAAALAVVLLLAVGVWLLAGRRGPDMQEGITLFRSGDFGRAAEHFERYARANPDDPTPRLYLARIHRRSGDFEAAAEELRRAIELAPEDAALHREVGFLLLDLGRADAAVGRFRTAVELDAESTEGWIGLYRALEASGQSAAAERILARAPADARALLQRQGAPPPRAP